MKNFIYSILVSFCCLIAHDILAQTFQNDHSLIKCLETKSGHSINPVKDILITSLIQTNFEHLNSQKDLGVITNNEPKKGISVDGEPVHVNAKLSAIKGILVSENLWIQALEKFESYEFEQAKRLFLQYCELNPTDEKAKFYFALSQLYLGQYGPAANKLSVLNKSVSLKNDPSKQMFKDEIKFYFAWSTLKVCDSPRMAIVLFNQLNYEGGKYQSIANEMINLLRH
ncbi:MAG: hypothetical protein IPM92_08390 [Saprospiraceae bacterium]|nr:hypothetical protein [Saprospiraceae bacterium]